MLVHLFESLKLFQRHLGCPEEDREYHLLKNAVEVQATHLRVRDVSTTCQLNTGMGTPIVHSFFTESTMLLFYMSKGNSLQLVNKLLH